MHTTIYKYIGKRAVVVKQAIILATAAGFDILEYNYQCQ